MRGPRAGRTGSSRGDQDARTDRTTRVGRRTRLLAARRRLGGGHGQRRPGGAARRARRGRHAAGHRRRLRRRPQRGPHRAAAGRARHRGGARGDQDGPARRPARAGGVLAPGVPGLDRPQPQQPRRRGPGPRAAALPADPGLLRRPGLRRPGPAGGRAADRRVRRLGGDGRGGADGHRATGGRQRAGHPERVPSQAAGAAAPRGGRRGCRRHRPGPAGQRPAVREVRREHHVRCG